jgi:hypothetical protein
MSRSVCPLRFVLSVADGSHQLAADARDVRVVYPGVEGASAHNDVFVVLAVKEAALDAVADHR